MKRRAFISLLGGAAAAWPLAARAQQADRVRRICVLMQLVESDPQGPRYATAFVQGLKDSGWVDGRNLQLEYRWAGDSPDRARTYAAELVRLKPDVMLAQGSMPVLALQRETRTIPIVFTQINDPVESGLVESMARPGGNLTGFFPLEFSAAAKWLAMLREIAPGLIRVAVIMRPDSLTNPGMLRALEASVRSLGLGLCSRGAKCPRDRTCRQCIRAGGEWSSDRTAEPHYVSSSRVGHQTSRQTPPAGSLSIPLLCHGRRSYVVRHRSR
jgi:putative tryptophan/tyrosine transport system substrate-binding protein